MRKRSVGHGPVQVEVRSDPMLSQLVLRDDAGIVELLPIRPDVLAEVRRELHERCGEDSCVLELRDADGTVRERWGTFAVPGHAAALGRTLLAYDQHADHAVVLAAATVPGQRAGTELLELPGTPSRWS